MRTIRVYTPQPLATNQTVTLDEQASRHLATVLRVKTGHPLTLFNGQGGEYTATVAAVSNKKVVAAVTDFTAIDRESPLKVTLGIGLSRGERMDWVVQKATELGVSAIAPLFTERSEVKLNPQRAEKKQQHWQHIIHSACEQSGRNRLPSIALPEKLDQWLAKQSSDRQYVLHHHAGETLINRPAPTDMKVTLLIGSEGGLSEEEVQRAQQHNFQPLTLGPRVMRTETAPIAALSVLQLLWGDFSS